MQCEMCGKKTETSNLVSVEGVELNVCNECSRFGKKINKRKEKPKLTKDTKRQIFEKIVNKTELLLLVTPDYSEKIKSAREKLGYRQIELAKKMGIRESMIQNVENGKQKPSIEFARKLEKALDISLVDEHKEEHKKQYKASSSQKFTLGDFIKVRKK
jgi:putative transcription factor